MPKVFLEKNKFYPQNTQVEYSVDRGETWLEGRLTACKTKGGNCAKVKSFNRKSVILNIKRVRLEEKEVKEIIQPQPPKNPIRLGEISYIEKRLKRLMKSLNEITVNVQTLKKEYE